MKARVKATGEIVEILGYVYDKDGEEYLLEEIEFNEPDYWDKLLHQYAGMAMQGLLSNERCWEENADKIAEVAICYAKELVKGLRIERRN